jgi:hypothetical protein
MVDVQGRTIVHQRGHGIYASVTRFVDPLGRIAQMHNFQIDTFPIDDVSDLFFCRNAHWTTRMVKNRFLTHVLLPFNME